MQWKHTLWLGAYAALGILTGWLLGLVSTATILTITYAVQGTVTRVAGYTAALIAFSLMAAGAYLGVQVATEKTIWYEVLRPTRTKIALALGTSLALVVLAFVFSGADAFRTASFQSVNPFVAAPFALIIYAFAFYPFSALAASFTHEHIEGRSLALALTLVVLLNPISLLWATPTTIVLQQEALYDPCGVRVVSFEEPSAAAAAGVPLNAVVLSMDGEPVATVADAHTFIAGVDGTERVVLGTNKGVFSASLVDGRLGANVEQAWCEPTPR